MYGEHACKAFAGFSRYATAAIPEYVDDGQTEIGEDEANLVIADVGKPKHPKYLSTRIIVT